VVGVLTCVKEAMSQELVVEKRFGWDPLSLIQTFLRLNVQVGNYVPIFRQVTYGEKKYKKNKVDEIQLTSQPQEKIHSSDYCWKKSLRNRNRTSDQQITSDTFYSLPLYQLSYPETTIGNAYHLHIPTFQCFTSTFLQFTFSQSLFEACLRLRMFYF
jgi:hypothetical protein